MAFRVQSRCCWWFDLIYWYTGSRGSILSKASMCVRTNTNIGAQGRLRPGSMLWSQFSAIFANFRQKIGVFLKNQCCDPNFV
jgi:hypothetical protein